MDLMIFEKHPGFVYHLHIIHSLALLNILEHFLVIVELYQGPEDPPGPSWTPKWTPKWFLRGKFWRILALKGPARVLRWSELVNFFLSCLKVYLKKLITLDHEGVLEGPFLPRVLQNLPRRIHFGVHLGVHDGPGGSSGPW